LRNPTKPSPEPDATPGHGEKIAHPNAPSIPPNFTGSTPESIGPGGIAPVRMAKFISVQDRDYDPIHRMARAAERVLLA